LIKVVGCHFDAQVFRMSNVVYVKFASRSKGLQAAQWGWRPAAAARPKAAARRPFGPSMRKLRSKQTGLVMWV